MPEQDPSGFQNSHPPIHPEHRTLDAAALPTTHDQTFQIRDKEGHIGREGEINQEHLRKEVTRVAHMLRDAPFPWHIGGGMSIPLLVKERTNAPDVTFVRSHKDIEVSITSDDAPSFVTFIERQGLGVFARLPADRVVEGDPTYDLREELEKDRRATPVNEDTSHEPAPRAYRGIRVRPDLDCNALLDRMGASNFNVYALGADGRTPDVNAAASTFEVFVERAHGDRIELMSGVFISRALHTHGEVLHGSERISLPSVVEMVYLKLMNPRNTRYESNKDAADLGRLATILTKKDGEQIAMLLESAEQDARAEFSQELATIGTDLLRRCTDLTSEDLVAQTLKTNPSILERLGNRTTEEWLHDCAKYISLQIRMNPNTPVDTLKSFFLERSWEAARQESDILRAQRTWDELRRTATRER